MKKPLLIAAIAVACICIFGGLGYFFWNEKDIKCRLRLRPVIAFVDAFIQKEGRCPDSDEFRSLNKQGGFIMKHNTEYVRRLGGTNSTDYILGCWRSEWHYCYKSWNGEFYNDYDNAIFGQ